MGLLDVLNGMANGPRGHTDPNSKGGMSPITMAILALLAYKGIKHVTASHQAPSPGGNPQRLPDGGSVQNTGQGGGLGDILGGLLGGSARGAAGAAPSGGLGGLLSGGLGGLLAGGAAGSVLSGGLSSLINQLNETGQGAVVSSWVGKGPNHDISESDLAKSIGADDIDALAKHTGLSRNELLAGLSRELPNVIDELTPEGRLPSPDEASRWV